MTEKPEISRRLDYELLRIIAIFGVVFNHSQHRGFELYALGGGVVNVYGSLVLGVLCKIAVPLFFLVSGGLLLHRDENISTVLMKRVLRIGVVIVLFSALVYLFQIRWGTVESPGFKDFVTCLWSLGVSTPYWYLYTYLGLMMMLPLLRPMVRGMGDRVFVYLAALHVIFYGVLGTAALVWNLGPMHSDLLIPMVEPYLFYFLMGHYLAHRFPWQLYGKKERGLVWILAVLAVAAMVALAALNLRRYGSVQMNYHKSLLIFPIFAIYAEAHQLFAQKTPPRWLRKFITTLGGCVFGTYLLEGILRYELDFIFEGLKEPLHVLPACLVWVLAVVACGMAITWVLKKLPGFRKLL